MTSQPKKLYRLYPSYHDNLWGGTRLREYGKRSDAPVIAESWEVSFVPENEATVDTPAGRLPLSLAFDRAEWGEACQDFPFFPVLTKFIDAREKLSVQVHPSDAYALAHEGQYGKSEMWYIVAAEPGAGIYMGLRRPSAPEEFARAVEEERVEELLHFQPVHPGETYFIEAGTVHAICGGVLLYEIQENSTLTYRLYDYGRRDAQGNTRPLHIQKAMAVARLEPYTPPALPAVDPDLIGECAYFTVHRYTLDGVRRFSAGKDSFLALTFLAGHGTAGTAAHRELYSRGDSFFAPAGTGEVTVEGEGVCIAVCVRGRQG